MPKRKGGRGHHCVLRACVPMLSGCVLHRQVCYMHAVLGDDRRVHICGDSGVIE